MNQSRTQNRVKKRSSTACKRCRQQKVKCTGVFPCEPCTRRRLPCTFDDRTQKILVTKGYITDLQRRANIGEHNQGEHALLNAVALSVGNDGVQAPSHDEEVSNWLDGVENNDNNLQRQTSNAAAVQIEAENENETSSSSARLNNPLAIDAANHMADHSGRPFYLGTSSNWSFGRRVLNMACDRLRVQLPLGNLHFEGEVYNLDWSTLNVTPKIVSQSLPSSDYAIYLINAVKFHCGQMFHLFDEETFMQNFGKFHESSNGIAEVPQLWYIHYLLIIAFGKAFTARNAKDYRPPGSDLFLEAMRRLPEITFIEQDLMEPIEILCCASLYLQCLDFRSHAYNLIGQALRKSLEQGFHTSMRSRYLTERNVQRCRKIFWTIYTLDRQMSSLMGCPMAIRDEDISAPLPTASHSSQTSLAQDLHVKLSGVIAQILNTVYSTEGRLDKKFLSSTKSALKNIASVTDQLNASFQIPDQTSVAGIPRLSAYLHLLHHQCICLATRPLAYSFLDRRLRTTFNEKQPIRPTGSVRVLLRMCIESAQQMLHILEALQNQNLLESFLPFDLESVFISVIVIIMISAIDNSLMDDCNPWIDIGYTVLDEMASRGNAVAAFRKRELEQLANILSRIPAMPEFSAVESNLFSRGQVIRRDGREEMTMTDTMGSVPYNAARDDHAFGDFNGQEEFTAEQLMLIADSLDLDGLDWMTASWGETSSHVNT